MEESFQSWFLNSGGTLHPNVEIASDSTGSFLRTRHGQDLPPGSCVVSCPHTLTLSWLNVIHSSESFLNDFDLRTASHVINETVLTRFFLMKQYALKEKSFWWSYIQSLPQPDLEKHLNLPFWYDAEDLTWIHGTNLEYAMREKEQRWRREFEEGARLLTLEGFDGNQNWSWQIYKWAATILSSRGFHSIALKNASIGQDITNNSINRPSFQTLQDNRTSAWAVLIPGLDLLNHLPSAKVTWNWGQSACSIINDELVKEDTQIWNNYGPKSNEECDTPNIKLKRSSLLKPPLIVLLGYGFSIFHNPIDVCNLAISQKITQRVKSIKTLHPKSNQVVEQALHNKNIEVTESCRTKNYKDGLSPTESTINNAANQKIDNNDESNSSPNELADPISQNMYWVSLKDGFSNLEHDHSNSVYEFSPGFLQMCSIAFANSREITRSDFCSSGSIEFTQLRLSRNKLHMLCAITMILQKQYVAITKHDEYLPTWPQNEKQFYAARYRRSQLRILRCVSESTLGELRGMAGLDSSKARDVRVVRLEHVLTESPKGLSTDYRAALNVGLGTRNATKIRDNGWVQCAFTIWLCGLCLWNSKNLQKNAECSSSDLTDKLSRWLYFLRHVYGIPPVSEFDKSERDKLKHENEIPKSDINLSRDHTSFADLHDERVLTVQSYFAIIKAAVNKYPKSIFGSSDVTVAYLIWCLDVIEAEGMMCPNLEGKMGEENDEFILFVEDSVS